MNIGDKVKWTGDSDEGPLTYVGKVMSIGGGFIEIDTGKFTIGVAREDGTFEVVKPGNVKCVPAPTVTTTVAAKSGTKFERAVDIYRNMKDNTRQKLIKAFVDQLEMTPAGASTYAAKVRKIK